MTRQTRIPTTEAVPIEVLHYVRGVVARLLMVWSLMSVGFMGLALLNDSERTSESRLRIGDATPLYVRRVGFGISPAMALLACISETVLFAARRARIGWNSLGIPFAVTWAVVAGGIALLCFPQEEWGPKQTMLIAGGAWFAYLLGSVQAGLWYQSSGSHAIATIPFAWLVGAAMLGSAFFGGLDGWTDIDPKVRRLLEYRTSRWGDPELPPLPPAEPRDERWVY